MKKMNQDELIIIDTILSLILYMCIVHEIFSKYNSQSNSNLFHIAVYLNNILFLKPWYKIQ